jgi:type II secretory pathway pseudopilin PulG
MKGSLNPQAGFTVVDILVVTAIIGIVAAIAMPSMNSAADRMRLGQAARNVEREMQTAKQRAIGNNRPMRVRFNCPAAGQFRIVELIGTSSAPAAADSAADRCSEATYPFPAADNNPLTHPNLDGPIRRIDETVTFSASQTIEFWPDGTAHYDNALGSPWPMIPPAGITISLARYNSTTNITVNGLGKITLPQ